MDFQGWVQPWPGWTCTDWMAAFRTGLIVYNCVDQFVLMIFFWRIEYLI